MPSLAPDGFSNPLELLYSFKIFQIQAMNLVMKKAIWLCSLAFIYSCTLNSATKREYKKGGAWLVSTDHSRSDKRYEGAEHATSFAEKTNSDKKLKRLSMQCGKDRAALVMRICTNAKSAAGTCDDTGMNCIEPISSFLLDDKSGDELWLLWRDLETYLKSQGCVSKYQQLSARLCKDHKAHTTLCNGLGFACSRQIERFGQTGWWLPWDKLDFYFLSRGCDALNYRRASQICEKSESKVNLCNETGFSCTVSISSFDEAGWWLPWQKLDLFAW